MMAPRKLLALTLVLSAPLAASAQAEAKPAEPAKPLVTVYGTLNVNFQITKASGASGATANVESRNSVSTDSSNIGVRGGLDVNEWVGAVYQCEISANLDGISASGICNRNSRLGITGNWGTLFYGNWDTPFKAVAYGTKADDPFLNTDVFAFNGIMGSPGFNYRSSGWSIASNTSTTGFDVRANNSVAYHSPRWEGLSVKLQYSANEFKNATGTQNPELFGAAVNFDYGPFSVLAAYERHNDGFALVGLNGAVGAAFGSTVANAAGTATAAASSNDSAWRVGAGYQLDSPFGATTVGVLFDQLILKQDSAPAGAVTEYKRNAWQVALKHRIGDHEFRGRYDQASAGDCSLNGGACSTSGYGANQFAVGYAYYFAKGFQGYLSFTRINNQYNAQYTPSIGGAPAVAGTTPKGADPQALGLGLRFAF
jgi:predicted porin